MAAALELRACPRAAHLPEFVMPHREHDVVLICDFGHEFVRPSRQFNVTRADPWFFRAAEVSDATQFSTDRPRVFAVLLHLFALARLELIRTKLSLPARPGPVLLSTHWPAATDGPPDGFETLDAELVASEDGLAAVRRVRYQFIAGNAAGLLASTDYQLGPLLSAARRFR